MGLGREDYRLTGPSLRILDGAIGHTPGFSMSEHKVNLNKLIFMDLVHLFHSEQIVPFEINAIGPVTASSAARYTTNDPASGQNSPSHSKRVLSSRQQKPKTLLKQR